MAKNYYKILGLTNVASEADIKKGYYKMALKYHPDKNQSSNANEQFKLIAEAYEVLSDTRKRKTYDSYQRKSNLGSEKWQYDFRNDPMQMFYEIFRNVSPSDVRDVLKEVKLTFIEFFELKRNPKGNKNTDTQNIGSDAENQPDHNVSAPNNVPNAQVRGENQDVDAARPNNFFLRLLFFQFETNSIEMMQTFLNHPTVKIIVIGLLCFLLCVGFGTYNFLTSTGQGVVYIGSGIGQAIGWGGTLGGIAVLVFKFILPFLL